MLFCSTHAYHQLVSVPFTHLSLLICIFGLVQSERHDSFPLKQDVYDPEDFIKIDPVKDEDFRNTFYENEKDKEWLRFPVKDKEFRNTFYENEGHQEQPRFPVKDKEFRNTLYKNEDHKEQPRFPVEDKEFRNTFYENEKLQERPRFDDVPDVRAPAQAIDDVLPKKRFDVLPLFYHENFHDQRYSRLKFINKRDTGSLKDLPSLPELPRILTLLNVSNLNESSHDNHTSNATDMEAGKVETTTKPPEEKKPELPPPGAAEEERHSSLTIFFILLVVAIAILLVHLLIQTKFHYMPDSIAIVLIGAFIGLFLKLFQFGNWKNEEAFPPTIFFIVLLPPIIFEGGYNLHKGNFFQNIGSILVFAVFGTVISAVVVGGGVYFLGQAEVVYKFDFVESFAFGSLVSAVDPVATLAIFQALDADPILYMLVFGESMLNDAVSIVLTSTMLEFASPGTVVASGTSAFFQAVGRFCLMFFASSAIGVAFGLLSAMVTKFVDLHKTPSLEVGIVFCFSYLPYALAEGIHLSGIMAILFCGIVMSHYTHLNLSPVSQITVQQTFRTIAFICETCVFAYLGLAIFSFKVNVKPAFTIWSIVLILLGRAFNIFPLSFLVNFFREHKITRKNQFIMWFSGLRGAVSFALSLHLEFAEEKHYILVTTTLIMVLFTTVFLGGATMPLLKFLQSADKKHPKKKKRLDGEVSMSKTKEMGDAIDSELLSEMTEDDETYVIKSHMTGFTKLDARYLIPFFTKRFTQKEMREGRSQVDMLATQWQKEVRAAPSESEDDNENTEIETCLITATSTASLFQNSALPPNGTV